MNHNNKMKLFKSKKRSLTSKMKLKLGNKSLLLLIEIIIELKKIL